MTDEGSNRFEHERHQWAAAVGSFVLAFGGIERATHHGLACIPKDAFIDAVADLPLSRRIRILESILHDRDRASGSAENHQSRQDRVI